ncbi:preprotein translocase, SecE subunit [Thermodesulfatator indicus DSM 15286]|uniref:Protein translocase subunit SecE n=1 Tax=Thermodesulfatator indicus (strain DSM 15286 / JCM 11887 / CIR29812) TaxID=667014 RepID=F8A9W5_THEID|nr:preprotein translocase subunit SecE [Thermodesulfatator indicus]AEH44163.1 preprotein translocase, SecE subunit [Thermodesulfatator indicus DSM 15286]
MAKRRTRKQRMASVSGSGASSDKGEAKVVPLQREENFIHRAKNFFVEVKVEFKKITWPTRKETLATTTAVVSFTLFVSFYLGIVDMVLSKLVQWLVY